ncbi:MAG TPA: chitosanase [Pyrinomonadaceae bacterium]|nr:chitosanase [Pyrinomonadaceae bacterium]
MADIFLSYSSKDEKRIMPLVKLFEQQDWSVWWDHKIRVGNEFDKVIEAEIAASKCLVVLWSHASVQSHWVKSEAEEGRVRGILAPVLIDKVSIPLGFRRFQTANLSDWKGETEHPELILLLQGIRAILEQSPIDTDKLALSSKLPIIETPNKSIFIQKVVQFFKVYPKLTPVTLAVLLMLFITPIIIFNSSFKFGVNNSNGNTNISNLNGNSTVGNNHNTEKDNTETPVETVSIPNGHQRAMAIVNIFEAGNPEGGNHSMVAIYGNGISYGYSGASLSTGTLYTLIKAYCNSPEAKFKDKFKPFLSRLLEKDSTLASDSGFIDLLKGAGKDDPVMLAIQNQEYERYYWQPSLKAAESLGIKTMLGITVIHDSIVHGSFERIKKQTIDKLKGTPISGVDEHTWINTYLNFRKKWMLNHTSQLMQRTVYRVEELLKLAKQDNWELKAPITVRGFIIVD